MSLFLNELQPLKLYSGTYYYPIDLKDRMKNSIVYLLTPSVDSSVEVLNHEFAQKNQNLFQAYFLEKNVDFIINNKSLAESALISINDEEPLQYNHTLSEELDLNNSEDFAINENMIIINDQEEKIRSIFPDIADEIIREAATVKTKFGVYNLGNIFRSLLFNERLKGQKDIIQLYDYIKDKVPYIKFTYTDPKIYKNRNVFYDWSYYTTIFRRNSDYRGDKGVDIFFYFISRYFNDTRFSSYHKKTVVIPVQDWIFKEVDPMDCNKGINPMNVIYRTLKTAPKRLDIWQDILFLFITNRGYFTFNPNEVNVTADSIKLMNLVHNMSNGNYDNSEVITYDSKTAIMNQLADKLEDSGISISNISGSTSKMSKSELEKKGLLDNPNLSGDVEVKKAALINKLYSIASRNKNAEETMDNDLDSNADTQESEWLKDLLIDLQSDEGIKMNAARTSRMNKSKEQLMTVEVKGKTVKQLLQEFKKNDDLPTEELPVDSIDDHWKKVKFPTFNDVYDMTADIVAMFYHFTSVTHPMNIVTIKSEDTSTSEDYKTTWSCQYEDAETGKRFTMTLDIPNLIGNRFMRLRGNEKILIGQLMLLPITKTDEDTVQVVSNYNKIFIRRKSPNGLTKSTPIINKLCKALDKYVGMDIKVNPGDNKKLSAKYQLPIEFIDIGSLYASIKFKDGSFISFNMKELLKYPIDKSYLPDNEKKLSDEELNKRYMAIYVKGGKRIPIVDEPVDLFILRTILEHDKSGSFEKLYNSSAVSKRLMYTEASILNTTMPVVVVLAYSIGLQKLLDRMKIKYTFQEKRPSKGETFLRFIDGYLVYQANSLADSLLLNGLLECDLGGYSIKEINTKDMWLGILDDFGGRIKADGLDNFYDLMFDPITVEICEILHIPSNYVDGLIYASSLLVDNKYNSHSDITSNRLRINEVIVAHLYLVLARAYGQYRNMVKRSKGQASFSAKKSAVIDSILNHDQTSSDLSTLNPLLEAESAAKVTFKGLSGMNSDRAFSLDKRAYDKSMLGIVGLSTGFASTVGIARQLTVDSHVLNKRGFMSARKPNELDNLNTFSIMEAISPLAVNHDDPFRTAMAFTQTSQHQMLVKKSMPMLITTGADEALPYLTSNKFSYKFMGNKGKVLEITKDYMIIQDMQTLKKEFIDLRETIRKNSDGGFYITTKLDPNVKVGQVLKKYDIVAYDKQCYSPAIGSNGNEQQISYNIGTLAKVAVMNTDMGYEDSCVVDDSVSEALASEYCVCKDIDLPANANIYNMVKVGQEIEEGEPLLVFQESFDEKEANELLLSLSLDNEELSDLGRKQVRSKITGKVQDIKIFRTVDIEKLSPTLSKMVKEYEGNINKLKNVLAKNKIDEEYTLEPTYKLPQEGKLKNLDGIRIEFYIKIKDKFGIGDKLVFSQALKGVNSYIIPKGKEAYTDFRPNEHVNAFLTISGVMGRMVGSTPLQGLGNKLMIELARKCQDILGIKWKPLQDIYKE